jgi:hypothetical protein
VSCYEFFQFGVTGSLKTEIILIFIHHILVNSAYGKVRHYYGSFLFMEQ